jgi:hypothetical protein
MAKLPKGEDPFDELQRFQESRFQMGGWGQFLTLDPYRRRKPSKLLMRLFKKLALVATTILILLAGIIYHVLPISILLSAAIWAIYWRKKLKSEGTPKNQS